MLQSLLLPFLFASTTPSQVEPEWTEVPALNLTSHPRAGKFLSGIAARLDKHGVGQVSNLVNEPRTYGHEGCHMINSWVTNKYGGRVCALYVGDGKAAILKEPRTTIQRVAQFVPAYLQGSRFNTYLVKQASGWNSRPLYLFDEWVAYQAGSAAAISQSEEGLPYEKNSDTAVGQVEFIPYVLAVYLAVKKDDPQYLETEDGKQFKAFLSWGIKRSLRQYHECQELPGLKWYYEVRLSDPRASDMKLVYDSLMTSEAPASVPPPQHTRLPQALLPQELLPTYKPIPQGTIGKAVKPSAHPFHQAATMPGTTAQPADGRSMSYPAARATGSTTIVVPSTGLSGNTNCPPSG